MLERIQNLATALVMGVASVFSFATAEHDAAAELFFLLEKTNTEDDFEKAKKTLYNDIEPDDDRQMVCRYSGDVVTLLVDGNKLKLNPIDKIEAEHTWASGAKWAQEEGITGIFDRDSVAGADLHNLFPVRKGINASRRNDRFGVPTDGRKEYGLRTESDLRWKVNFTSTGRKVGSFIGKRDDGKRVFEPRDEHKGDVARAMFYMSVRYWFSIPDRMEATLKDWHAADPPDDAERARNERVEAEQHNRNPFVDEPDLVGEIDDF